MQVRPVNLSLLRAVYEHGLPDHVPAGWPLHRLTVEFPGGIPIQGDHVPARHLKGGVRDKRQAQIDAGRLEVAVAAMIEPSRPVAPYPEGTPMFVEVTARIPRPKSTKAVHLLEQVALGGAGRGDGDKVCRFVWDALNARAEGGAAWFDDDSMVGEWQGRRVWSPCGHVPRIEVAVVPLQVSAPPA